VNGDGKSTSCNLLEFLLIVYQPLPQHRRTKRPLDLQTGAVAPIAASFKVGTRASISTPTHDPDGDTGVGGEEEAIEVAERLGDISAVGYSDKEQALMIQAKKQGRRRK
jgi:hypothetical protein